MTVNINCRSVVFLTHAPRRLANLPVYPQAYLIPEKPELINVPCQEGTLQ
jgi:hypothetical protein